MKKTALMGVLLSLSTAGFSQYFEGDVRREFGVKTGLVKVKYESVDGSKRDRNFQEFLSAYGLMSAVTSAGFSAGAGIEVSSGNTVEGGRSLLLSSVELNPQVDLPLGDLIRLYTGFGGSINIMKERVGSRINRDTNFGLQFFVGVKLSPFPTFGLLAEYKGKIFMTGDYEGNVVHHINLGLFFNVF